MPDSKMEEGLAVAMAGQVAVGLTPGDDQDLRAQAALMALGMMLLNACPDDERVRQALAASDSTLITRTPGGGWQIEMRGDG
jgi:hypothetical protein